MSTATRGKKPIIPAEKLPPSFRRAKPVVLPQKGYNEYSESELVDQFTPMVIKWVHRLAYHPSLKQEMDDLRNIGLTALIKAKRNFKPELKVPFVAYCSTRIRARYWMPFANDSPVPAHWAPSCARSKTPFTSFQVISTAHPLRRRSRIT